MFLVWEKSDVASACGSWPVSQSALPEPKAIQDVLEHPEEVHSACWLSGDDHLDMEVAILQDQATPCGSVTRKGNLQHLRVGDLVAKKHQDRGRNRWRVMAFTGNRIELRRADRRHPDFALVKLSALAFTLKDTIRVHRTCTDKIPGLGECPPEDLKIGDEWGGQVLNMRRFTSSFKRPRHPNDL